MSFIIGLSEEPDETLLALSQDLQSGAEAANDAVRAVPQDGLTEEEIAYLYGLDAMTTPPNIRGYLMTTADDSGRLIGGALDLWGSLPDGTLKTLVSSAFEALNTFFAEKTQKYAPPPPPEDPEA